MYIPYDVITTLSSNHLSLWKVITMLSTMFPVPYTSSLWLVYFIIGILYPLFPFTFFTHPAPTPLLQPSVCSVSVSLFLICFVFVLNIYIYIYFVLNIYIYFVTNHIGEWWWHGRFWSYVEVEDSLLIRWN